MSFRANEDKFNIFRYNKYKRTFFEMVRLSLDIYG